MATLRIYSKDVKTTDGRSFTAYESRDKKGNRVNIAFALKGKAAPDKYPVTVELISAKWDKRKAFPTLRIWDYKIIDDRTDEKPKLPDGIENIF